ncbi:MAG: hypothetical protein LC635_04835, partial [Pseudonocardiaceae bacterium]|nr:hypothetical protein [Pseudonocardiaceae bacterium]
MATTTQVYLKNQESERSSAAPLAWSSITSVVLFLLSLVVGIALTGSVYASPFGDTDTIRAYFADNPGAVALVGTLQFASALALLGFTSLLAARLRA